MKIYMFLHYIFAHIHVHIIRVMLSHLIALNGAKTTLNTSTTSPDISSLRARTSVRATEF